MKDLKIAIIQAELHWENADGNLAMFEEKIWTIHEEVDLILLPEMFSTGFSMNPAELAEVSGLKTQKWMLQMAVQRDALVGGSYIVRQGEHFYNRFVFAFPDGTIQFYDKRHLFSLAKEEDYFTAGQERLVVTYKGWRICPMVCYDLRFPVWARNHVTLDGDYGYDLLLYVANWPKVRIKAWDTLLPARAIENLAYVAGVNRTGLDGNEHLYDGHSAVYDALGEQMTRPLIGEEGILIQKVDKLALDMVRQKFAFLRDADAFDIR
ncbi:amidohydrolase [Reichenbachiella sp. MSK19-1]|uniref:amidohydrolase n=1 Tax=Reichenbachiella sp. MSK19-1 TaxID=1897631 RepID=UPI000E6D0D57|nr:amidohydrolase [Reichenbachiella sp. MSK19-1]RJE71379.1 amidohydrolase [Reichenbachiella sp. MSK19-1]